jgi:PadR family transcriptional regulator, regulatory protein PadR
MEPGLEHVIFSQIVLPCGSPQLRTSFFGTSRASEGSIVYQRPNFRLCAEWLSATFLRCGFISKSGYVSGVDCSVSRQVRLIVRLFSNFLLTDISTYDIFLDDGDDLMAADRSFDLLKSASDLVVLSVLADRPLYGYAITKQVAARSNGAVRLTPGVLYPLLHELEKQGLLVSSWDTVQAEGNEDEGRGRKRKWYRLSAKGRKRLTQRAAAHRAYQALIESFIPRLGDQEGR